MEGWVRMAKAKPRELPIPPDTVAAKEAIELFRGWLIDDQLQCSLFPTAFPDPAVWGMLLADAARHIANALAENEVMDRETALAAIASKFAEEMQSPSDEHLDEYMDPK
jgi:hypothetical protein